MAIDPTTFGELTKPYRFVDEQSAGVLAAFPLARSVEDAGFLSTIAGVQAVADERFGLLSVYRRRFLVTIEGCDYINASDFAGAAPSAILKSSRYGLAAGRRVAIVKFECDYGTNRTRLLVWG